MSYSFIDLVAGRKVDIFELLSNFSGEKPRDATITSIDFGHSACGDYLVLGLQSGVVEKWGFAEKFKTEKRIIPLR